MHHIRTDQRLRLECMRRRFLKCLADLRLDQRFARFEMTSRLIDAQSGRRVFFDDEKAPVTLDDGSHRYVGTQVSDFIVRYFTVSARFAPVTLRESADVAKAVNKGPDRF